MKTYSTKLTDIKRQWHLFDLQGKILGREATKIAELLIGKNKIYYTPHLDCGDYVVVINADKVRLTGSKEQQKKYYRHSGYPGGLKVVSFQEQMAKDSRKVISLAVSRMLPKNKLQKQRMKRLKIFKGKEHSYAEKMKKLEKKINWKF